MKCPICGSTAIIEHNGEYVCTNCGTVLGPVTEGAPNLGLGETRFYHVKDEEWRYYEKCLKKTKGSYCRIVAKFLYLTLDKGKSLKEVREELIKEFKKESKISRALANYFLKSKDSIALFR